MRNTILSIAFVVATVYGLLKVTEYAGVWDNKVNPTKSVIVKMVGRPPLEGSFYVDWSGDWILTDAAGVRHVVSDAQSMHVAPPSDEDTASISVVKHWRGTLPPTLYILLLAGFCVYSLFMKRRVSI